MKVTVKASVDVAAARKLLMIAGFDVTKKTDIEVAEQAVRGNDIFGVVTESIEWDTSDETDRVKPLSEIEGFDDVGIGVIPGDAGEGTFIDIRRLEGYDLSGISMYRYRFTTMSMRPVDNGDISNIDPYDGMYCVKRSDLEGKEDF